MRVALRYMEFRSSDAEESSLSCPSMVAWNFQTRNLYVWQNNGAGKKNLVNQKC